jgi:hypothetical protein
VSNWKFGLIAIFVALGLTRIFTTDAISVIATVFSVSSILVFSGAALFGLATKLRA